MFRGFARLFARMLAWRVGLGNFQGQPKDWQFCWVDEVGGDTWIKPVQVFRWPGGWRIRFFAWLCFVDPAAEQRLYEPLFQTEYTGLNHGAWLELTVSGGYHGRLVILLPTTLAGVSEIGPGEISWQSYRARP